MSTSCMPRNFAPKSAQSSSDLARTPTYPKPCNDGPCSDMTGLRQAESLVTPLLLRRDTRGSRVHRHNIVHRRLHATCLVRDAGERQPHLGAGQRPDDGEVVGVAEMADAEELSGVTA